MGGLNVRTARTCRRCRGRDPFTHHGHLPAGTGARRQSRYSSLAAVAELRHRQLTANGRGSVAGRSRARLLGLPWAAGAGRRRHTRLCPPQPARALAKAPRHGAGLSALRATTTGAPLAPHARRRRHSSLRPPARAQRQPGAAYQAGHALNARPSGGACCRREECAQGLTSSPLDAAAAPAAPRRAGVGCEGWWPSLPASQGWAGVAGARPRPTSVGPCQAALAACCWRSRSCRSRSRMASSRAERRPRGRWRREASPPRTRQMKDAVGGGQREWMRYQPFCFARFVRRSESLETALTPWGQRHTMGGQGFSQCGLDAAMLGGALGGASGWVRPLTGAGPSDFGCHSSPSSHPPCSLRPPWPVIQRHTLASSCENSNIGGALLRLALAGTRIRSPKVAP